MTRDARSFVFVLISCVLLVVPAWVLTPLRMFAAMLTCLVIVFAVWEGASIAFEARTLSRSFWEWGAANRRKAWIVLGCMLAAWMVVVLHLAAEIGGK